MRAHFDSLDLVQQMDLLDLMDLMDLMNQFGKKTQDFEIESKYEIMVNGEAHII